MSIHWPILRALAKNPLRLAVVDDRRSFRAIDILVGAWHLAAYLGPRCQSKTIGLLLPTSGVTPIAALAGWWLGKTVVPINYLLKPEEMNYVIRDCGCDTVVTVLPMLDFLGASVDECLYGKSEVGSGKSEVENPKPETRDPKPGSAVKHLVKLEDVSFKGLPDPVWPARASDDDLAVLLYTSGTSGKPKGVMLSHGNLKANMRQVRDWASFQRSDVVFGVLPQFHSFGLTVLTLLPLTYGMKAVYTARFIPHNVVSLIREHRATIMIAIPSMYNAMLHAKSATREDFASARYVVSGGEPLPQAVFDGFRERFGVTINEGYGLTETSPVTNWCRPSEWKRGSVGPALPEIDQRIIDIETGRELPPFRDGEVRMRGPNVMQGYFGKPQETAATFDERGYFRTGDIGRLDEDGHLYITGRLKEMLIIGGENVFPREIEEVLNAHPSVKDSGVVGKADPMRGEVPVAFVEMKEAGTDGGGTGSSTASGSSSATQDAPAARMSFDEKELLKWCRGKLAGYKVPDEIRVVDALPRNPTGKVMRRELKKLIAEK